MHKNNASYALENNTVFSPLRNIENDNEKSRKDTGREFHKAGPDTVKLDGPYLFVLILDTQFTIFRETQMMTVRIGVQSDAQFSKVIGCLIISASIHNSSKFVFDSLSNRKPEMLVPDGRSFLVVLPVTHNQSYCDI